MRPSSGWTEMCEKIVRVLKYQDKIDLEQCKAEPCTFRQMTKNEVLLVIEVHVEDIIVAGEKDVF